MSITVKYGWQKTKKFFARQAGLSLEFILNAIVTFWELDKVKFDIFDDKEDTVLLSDNYLLVHGSPPLV